MRAWVILVVLGFAIPPTASGQALIRGRVTDGATAQILPGATIQVDGQTAGTITNTDGEFSLPLPRLPAVLIVRHIGYRSRRIPISRAPAGPLDIQLEADPVLMEGVVVTGEDPAVRLMRNVLARKQSWVDTVQTAYAEAYSRFMLYREFDLVQVQETIGASWWSVGRGVREVTRARRFRPDRNERFLYADILAVPNFYGDEVVLDGTRYRSALHRDALRFYRFRIAGQRSQDGRIVHDVSFTPTNLTLAGFVGTLAVEDSTFDVLSMTARPVVDRIGPPPIQGRSVRLQQQFVQRGGGMVPISFLAEGWVRFGRAGVSYPRARFRQVSGLSLHATRVQVPDSLFAGTRALRDDPAVEAGTWLFDWNPGMIPLSEEEAADVVSMRSDRRIADFFRPEGLLSQYAAVPVAAPRLPPGGQVQQRRPRLAVPWLWYNRVDGWHLGLQPEIPIRRSLTLKPGVAFDEATDRVSWFMRAEWDAGGRFDVSLGAERFSAISGIGSRRDRFLTGLATYAGYDDYFDYYDRERRFARLGILLSRVRLEVGVTHEDHRSMEKADGFEGWLHKNVQRENPPVQEGRLASAEFRVVGGNAELNRPGWDSHVDVRTEIASEGLAGSDFGFSRWQGAGSVRIPTFLRRRSNPASLRLDVVAGGGSSGVPIQRQGILDVATGLVARAVAFRSRRDARLTARKWLAMFWEHDFGSLIAERLGWGETGYGLLVFGAHGTAWHGDAFRRDEVGLAWSTPFNLPFRINFATELNGFDPLVTIEYYGLARRLLRR